MAESRPTLVIAADGGGTRCRMRCTWDGGYATVETGAANVSSDFEGALASLREGLDGLVRATGFAPERIAVAPAYLGLAGVTGPEIAARVAAALPMPLIRVEDDRPAALRGALGDREGAVAHCGTGSFLGLRRGTRVRFAGGWGWRLGDEASAHWVGREALSAALRGSDGTEPQGALGAALLDELGGPAGVVAFAHSATPPVIAALAPRVAEAATKDDVAAIAILRRGTEYIATTLRAMGWARGMAFCLTGGFAQAYLPWLPLDLRTALTEPQGSPLEGAVTLAYDMVHEAAR
jgi:glucosamine kinase